ncbi:MAG: hypothetical protein LKH74_03230 [Levilactobacillus sp.]|jgi:hypothetical protein|uniref:Uncharacterized protein n=1 Tax=Levilactobacillus suantsaiihabitans TaxID=2487722 RepID=A0A4Z0JB41_9LACO|nr:MULTISPECIES: hypothetical protein [Levilactobacillus]MCI1552914.1 hypothetical protein [Levilactobacillus sp.]MCI1598054.1 hypothetical protein [Levilactobacillus sp.]MCI1605666.1 hypothetical protein [Levilactobacillus sp.]TGD20019.1 hypothetical protein EGT51_02180 [Levilactobacillus suantsaiihabitans]
MKDRNVIAWAIISMVGFVVLNFLMSRPFVDSTNVQMTMSEFWRTTLIAVVLYVIPIVLAALDWHPSFYLMGLVIALYTLSPISVLFNMWMDSGASVMIKLLMSAYSLALIVGNAYWLVLALRLRQRQQKIADRKRFAAKK